MHALSQGTTDNLPTKLSTDTVDNHSLFTRSSAVTLRKALARTHPEYRPLKSKLFLPNYRLVLAYTFANFLNTVHKHDSAAAYIS